MVKLVYDAKMKSPKGPCVIVIHASWCGHCKTLMPKFENDIITSHDFNPELEGLLTLGSIEEAEYNNHPEKKIFGNIDGYPTIRYIRFSQNGKPLRSFDLPPNTPREPKDIIAWINDAVKNDIHTHAVKNDIHTHAVKNKTLKNSKKKMNGGMNGGRKNKKYGRRTTRKHNKRNKNKTKQTVNK